MSRMEPEVKVPPVVIPILEETLRSPLVHKSVPLEIWRAADHRTWVSAFTELGLRLFQSDLPEDHLPIGYIQVAFLFDWEAQCQFSGWHAFNNRAETVHRVLRAY